MFAAMMWVDAACYCLVYTSPLSRHIRGGDLSLRFVLMIAGLAYLYLSRATLHKEQRLLTAQ